MEHITILTSDLTTIGTIDGATIHFTLLMDTILTMATTPTYMVVVITAEDTTILTETEIDTTIITPTTADQDDLIAAMETHLHHNVTMDQVAGGQPMEEVLPMVEIRMVTLIGQALVEELERQKNLEATLQAPTQEIPETLAQEPILHQPVDQADLQGVILMTN